MKIKESTMNIEFVGQMVWSFFFNFESINGLLFTWSFPNHVWAFLIKISSQQRRGVELPGRFGVDSKLLRITIKIFS